ncbi:MAG: hypothetical protein AAGF86_12750 [Pseudomonadota bacterium]
MVSFLSKMLGIGGAGDAAQKANASAGRRTGIINEAFDEASGFLAPLAAQGGEAFELYMDFLGVNGPERQAMAYQTYLESPEISFLQEEGANAVERSAAARGGLFSGRTAVDLQERGQRTAQTGMQNFLTRLAGAGNTGVGVSTNLANLASGRGTALSGIERDRGAASVAGVLGQQNEAVGLTTGLANIASFGLGGGFDKVIDGLSGGRPVDFRRAY